LPFATTGPAAQDFYVTGHPWSACYLLDGKKPVLFESGYTCAGRLYEESIRTVLGKREPSILFLTHVHYDHCGATGYLKRAFPSLLVAASERAARIMERPNAWALMGELSADAVSFVSETLEVDRSKLIDAPFEPFGVDLVLGDGQTVELGNTTVQVLASPGHTRDMLSYYIPERKILIATEAVGVQDMTGRIIIAALTDYDAYVASLERLSSLPVEVLCQGHRLVWTGAGEVRDYFARAMAAAKSFREQVTRLLGEEQGSVERVVARIKVEEYDANPYPKQQEAAYLINLRVRVDSLARGSKERGPGP